MNKGEVNLYNESILLYDVYTIVIQRRLGR